MFKFPGLILISISIFIVINRNIIFSYFTYLFIKEAVTILENMKSGCLLGKTYSKVFSEMDYSDFYFFTYRTEYRHSSVLFSQRTSAIDRIFSQSGQRGKSGEIEFLSSNITMLNEMADKYIYYVDTNKKTQLISSVSVVLIITIVIV